MPDGVDRVGDPPLRLENPVSPVPAPDRARAKTRHWAALAAFALIVALPTALATLYLFLVAADRYGARVAFSVRSHEGAAPVEFLGGLTQIGQSGTMTDTRILYDFLQSREAVEAVGARLPLELYFDREPSDWVFGLGEDRTAEDLTEHWNGAIDVALEPSSGILDVEVRAFRPEDAEAIAAAVLDASAALINRLTEAAREDAVAHARGELAEAEERLRGIRRRLRSFRDSEQDVDPAANAQATLDLVAGLERELADAQVELGLLAGLGRGATRVRLLEARIATLERRIAAERTRLGAGAATPAGRPLAQVVGDFEELVVDRDFAEQAYTLALATYEQAVAEARRRQRFLAVHVPPSMPERSDYPDRPLLVLAVFALATALWGTAVLIAWNVRDRT